MLTNGRHNSLEKRPDNTVKLANSIMPVLSNSARSNYNNKLVLRMKKCVFKKEKVIDTVYEKHIFVLLNTSLTWDFNLVEFDRNGEIS